MVERYSSPGWGSSTPWLPSYYYGAYYTYGYPYYATGNAGSYMPQFNVPKASASPYNPNTFHQAMQTLLMDGSVRGVTPSISTTTWTYAMQPDDGQVLGGDW